MRLSTWQIVAARLLFLSYVLFTASYCVLGYIPFTYQQVIVGELLPRVTRLAYLHPFLFWPAFACALLTIWTSLKDGPSRYLARGFAGAGLIVGIGLFIHPLLTSLSNNASSLWLGMLSLVPLLWIAIIDWVDSGVGLPSKGADGDGSRTFLACVQTALFLALTYFEVGRFRAWPKQLQPSWTQTLQVFIWSLLSHLLFLLLVFVVLDSIVVTATLLPNRWQRKAATLGSLLMVTAMLGMTLRYITFPPLAFGGLPASLVAVVMSVGLVSFASGIGVRLRKERGYSDEGLDLLVSPFRSLRSAPRIVQALAVMALAGLAWLLAVQTSRLDWEFLVQKMAVIFIGTTAFAIFYTITLPVKRAGRIFAYCTAVVVLVAYLGMATTYGASNDAPPSAMSAVLEQYAGYDISFRFVNEIIRPGIDAKASGPSDSFYAFLAENTNIPRSKHLLPIDIKLVDDLHRSTLRRPHIFFFVIDSLRRDYLTPYNAAVDFTPALNALANDSVVFKNAFTHYGGTGLSEPSIWVGGLMAHQQYTTPFGPMNSLQKLLDINGYREWISKDNILQQVVPPSPNVAELDAHVGAMSYDLCRTLKELTGRLPTVASTDNPVFVYTQAQNIHVSVIDRAGRSVPEGASFPPGIDPAYASRLQAMDGCFGKFIGALKTQGIYDDSVIVVTSDHGDSLGEMGRWGHAYTIFPEIVRIPLLVHLPSWLGNEVKSDPEAVTFLTDLTPSLYYLLGERPIIANPLFGRPLFTAALEEQRQYLRDSYLLVSSYAPVYGLLTQNGRRLYIADGVNFRDYAYALNDNGTSLEMSADDGQRTGYHNLIEEKIKAISAFYKFY